MKNCTKQRFSTPNEAIYVYKLQVDLEKQRNI